MHSKIINALKNHRFSLAYYLYRMSFRKKPHLANLAVKLASKKSIKLLEGVNRLSLPSEDGSGQYTHPDVIF